jgi:hypothetical protein
MALKLTLIASALILASAQALAAVNLHKGVVCTTSHDEAGEAKMDEPYYIVAGPGVVSLNQVSKQGRREVMFGELALRVNHVVDLGIEASEEGAVQASVKWGKWWEVGGYRGSWTLNLNQTTGTGTVHFIRKTNLIGDISAPLGDADVTYNVVCENSTAAE